MDAQDEFVVKNFSCWSLVLHGDVLVTEFGSRFQLYPRGVGGRGEHLVVNVGPRVSELSFISSDGSVICTRQPDEGNVRIFTGPKFEEVVARIRGNEPLHKDRLILRCKASQTMPPIQGCSVIDAYPAFFQIKPEAFQWQFSGSRSSPISKICFKDSVSGLRYILHLRICKTVSTLGDRKVKFELESRAFSELRAHIKVLTKISVWMIESGNVIRKYEDDCMIDYNERKTFPLEIPEKEFPEKGILTLMRCKVITGKSFTKYYYYSERPFLLKNDYGSTYFVRLCGKNLLENTNALTSNPTRESSSLPIHEDQQPENAVTVLAKDLMCLYQDQEFSDLELRCGGISFPTHKIILCARSPVLKAMLSGDMREAACGHVDIEDLDPHTLGRFLAFFYSGTTGQEALQWPEAAKLYYAADKYLVLSLKEECSAVLRASVSLESVCDILSLADKHQDQKLKSVVRDFISKNFNEVLRSENWAKLMTSDSLLAVETVTDIAKNKNVKISDSN